MIRISTFLFFLLSLTQSFGQDSTKITYTEEKDTLVKQRFIDQYENVFMTKVPTRHMLKLGLEFYPTNLYDFTSPEVQNLNYHLGYEFKALQNLSIGADITINGGYGTTNGFVATVSSLLYTRWYYDMKKRIREGKGANNFTGNYFAIVAGKRWKYTPALYPLKQIGIEFGIHRRFLNYGRLEFAVGAYYQRFSNGYYSEDVPIGSAILSDFEISTKSNLGLAFGDWKRASHGPLCDILNCEEFVKNQWKLLWPVVRISSRIINGTIGIGYERKLGKTPVSVNTQLIADFRKGELGLVGLSGGLLSDQSHQIQTSIQMRYYAFQRAAIRKGKGGNNLSGLYLGPHFDYIHYNYEMMEELAINKKHFGPGFTIGFQKTLFRKAYLDISGVQSWNLLSDLPTDKASIGSLRVGFGFVL